MPVARHARPSATQELARAIEHHRAGQLDMAEALYRATLRMDPTCADAHANLGILRRLHGDLEDAIACYRRSLDLKPDNAAVHYNLGIALQAQHRPGEAEASYRRALALSPTAVATHNNLGNVLKDLGRLDEAVGQYRQAIALQPDYPEAFNNLGAVLAEQGRADEARLSFRRAWELSGNGAMLLKSATTLPIIALSPADIESTRQRFFDGVRAATALGIRIANPLLEVGQTSFYLAYHAADDRPLQTALAQLFAAATPTLLSVAPHCLESPPAGDRRLRIGFVSEYFFSHTIAKLNRGLIRNLSRDRFHVTLFLTPRAMDYTRRQLIEASDHVVEIPMDLDLARRRIAEQRLDIVYYPDIGMSPLTYFLAFARLAPVQCAAWGHPDTTGIANLDYFLSCDAMEPEGAARHYTDSLARLPGPTIHYYRPKPPPPRTKADFGLSADAHLYLCPQSLFKIHPDYDAVLVAILRRDPAGLLAFIRGKHPHIDAQLLSRITAAAPEVADRIRLLPPQDTPDFIALMSLCAVMLDPLHYSGGNTSLEAFSVGTPIVTWPGEFMRGRHTYGFYKLMGLDDGVARDWDDYVTIALRLGTDPAYRAAVSRRILAANGVLFENRGTVRALEDFLIDAVRRR